MQELFSVYGLSIDRNTEQSKASIYESFFITHNHDSCYRNQQKVKTCPEQ